MASEDSATIKPKPSRRLMASVVGLLLLVGVVLVLWLKSGQGDVPAAKPPVVAVAPSSVAPAAVPIVPVAAKPELPPGISGDPMEAFAWDGKLQGMHIMSMCKDTRGRLWVGTEGNGAWCWDPNVALKQLQAEQAWAIERKRLGTPESAAPAKAKLYGWSQHTRVTTGGKPEEHGPVLTTGTSDVNSLGDDCVYAIACYKQGRIWAGHLNHGVSVYDGRQIPIKQPEKGYEGWRNYDVLSGPLGERVFDIGVNPVDGDVWITTDAGLSRYRVAVDTWNYYTRADGLPADQVQALAFLKDGSVVAGTQCDGLGIATPVVKAKSVDDKATSAGDKAIPAGDKAVASTLEYPTWRHVTTEDNSYDLPKTPIGVGLPSNLINDLLVTRDGALWVATTTGIAKSTDGGKTWIFIRGEDWEVKLRGLVTPPTNDEINIAKQLVPIQPQALLLEDYTTTIAEDSTGNLWIGHWRRGLEIMNAKGERTFPAKDAVLYRHEPKMNIPSFVRALLAPRENGLCVVGAYGEGLQVAEVNNQSTTTPSLLWREVLKPDAVVAMAVLPSAIQTGDVKSSRNALPPPQEDNRFGDGKAWAKTLGDDWMTWGDWCGRYGSGQAILCSMSAPLNHEIGSGINGYRLNDWRLGPKHANGDVLRHWVHWLSTSNSRVLYSPVIGFRREAEWDDHGETYPASLEGPDIWFSVDVPPGTHALSLYFFNPNAETPTGRLRDYMITIRSYEANIRWSHQPPVLARTRVREFHGGGIYKQFAVRGPCRYNIRIDRNYSFNTLMNGIFFDCIAGYMPSFELQEIPPAHFGAVSYRRPVISPAPVGSNQELAEYMIQTFIAVKEGKTVLSQKQAENADWRQWTEPFRLQAFRRLVQGQNQELPAGTQEAWRWDLRLWTADDRRGFGATMRSAWESSVKLNPWMRKWVRR